jgi:putative tricarboxylic transport membrane protein
VTTFPQSLRADRILGVVLLLLAAGAAWHAQSLVVPFAADPVGPRAFPTVVAVVLGASALLILLRPRGGWESPPRSLPGLVCILAMLGYALALQPLGFVPATALLCLVIARAFDGTWLQSLISAVAIAPGLWLLLDKALDLPLPKGMFGF